MQFGRVVMEPVTFDGLNASSCARCALRPLSVSLRFAAKRLALFLIGLLAEKQFLQQLHGLVVGADAVRHQQLET